MMGIQDPSKINYERLNLILVLVMGSPVRPCIALCWVYTGPLTARAAGSTHFFKAATVPWAADGQERYLRLQLHSLRMGITDITEQRMPAEPSPNQPPETPLGGGKLSRQVNTHDRKRSERQGSGG